MTPEEATALAGYVSQLCPQQKFDEYTADAWYDVLYDFTLEEARAAVPVIARRQAFIAPGEIVTEARRARRDRMAADAETEAPNVDPNNVPLYLRQIRDRRRDVATGRTAPVPALPTSVSHDDIKAMRQQKDLAAFIKQAGQEAKGRCAARVQIVKRHPDLVERVADLLGHEHWNGYVAPEYDSVGRLNTCPRRTGLLAILAEAEERTR